MILGEEWYFRPRRRWKAQLFRHEARLQGGELTSNYRGVTVEAAPAEGETSLCGAPDIGHLPLPDGVPFNLETGVVLLR